MLPEVVASTPCACNTWRMLCVTFVFAAALCRESKAMSGRGICYTNAGCDCYGTDCDTCHKSSVIIREISHILTRATFW